MKYPKFIFSVLVGLMALTALFPFSTLAVDYLTNGGFNKPFNDITSRVWHSQYEQIANGWTHFYIAANTEPGSGDASKLHWMQLAQFGSNFGGYDYHPDGDASQVIWSS